jgi:hypothetical protein
LYFMSSPEIIFQEVKHRRKINKSTHRNTGTKHSKKISIIFSEPNQNSL